MSCEQISLHRSRFAAFRSQLIWLTWEFKCKHLSFYLEDFNFMTYRPLYKQLIGTGT
jgi:hypothetical protein